MNQVCLQLPDLIHVKVRLVSTMNEVVSGPVYWDVNLENK